MSGCHFSSFAAVSIDSLLKSCTRLMHSSTKMARHTQSKDSAQNDRSLRTGLAAGKGVYA